MTAKKQTTKNDVMAMQVELPMLFTEERPEYLSGASRGNENVTMDDLMIPRLEIVQGLSPAVKRGDPGYIEGAKLGDLINSATRETYGDFVYIVPVHFSVQHLVWKMRAYQDSNGRVINSDGGFFGAYATDWEAQKRAIEEGGLQNGVEVMATPQHLCLLINTVTNSIEELIVSMPRTKAKVSRNFNTLVKIAGGDRFSRVYKLGTELQKNAKGDFYNYSVKIQGFPSKEVYDKAEQLYLAINSGEKQVLMDTSDLGSPNSENTFESEM